jgi:hypothetical protein
MTRGRLFLLIALAAVAVELFALRPVLFERDGPIDDSQVMYGLIGCSFVAFGLVGWHRRPDRRVGMLMTAAGFGFFGAPVVAQFEGPVAFLVAVLLLDPWPFFFVALLLSLLTSGRDEGIGGADEIRGSGLRGLADRVEALDGHLRVVSPAGGGTSLMAELPCR